MKLNKILSMMCAICLTLSLAIPANAAELSASNQLSSYAGSTMKVQVVEANWAGNVEASYIVDVPVPVGATKAEVSDLVRAAITPQTLVTTSLDVSVMDIPFGFDLISSIGPINLGSTLYTYVGGGQLSTGYETLLVQFLDTATTNASQMRVRVNSTATPTIDYDLTVDIINRADAMVVYYAGVEYGGNPLPLSEDSTISVYAETVSGSLTIVETCDVSCGHY